MAVRTGGREARTHYEVVDRFDDTARLAVSLETGRTHQIRVHLAAIGHPVLGDPVYGRTDPRIARPFLHAAELAFVASRVRGGAAPPRCRGPRTSSRRGPTLGPAR